MQLRANNLKELKKKEILHKRKYTNNNKKMHDKLNTYSHQEDTNGNHLMTIVNNIVLNPENF